MTLTFNSNKYTELLIKYQPKVIKNYAENEQALAKGKGQRARGKGLILTFSL